MGVAILVVPPRGHEYYKTMRAVHLRNPYLCARHVRHRSRVLGPSNTYNGTWVELGE